MQKKRERPVTGPEVGRRVVKKPWTEVMLCELTPEELWAKSVAVSQANVAYQRVELEKKAEVKKYNETLKQLRKEMDTEARKVVTGQEEREVEMQEIYDIPNEVIYCIRVDTGEVMFERRPTSDERQTDFGFGTPGAPS